MSLVARASALRLSWPASQDIAEPTEMVDGISTSNVPADLAWDATLVSRPYVQAAVCRPSLQAVSE